MGDEYKFNKIEENIYYLKLYNITSEYSEMLPILLDLGSSKYSLTEYEINIIVKSLKHYINTISTKYKKLKEYNIKDKGLKELHKDQLIEIDKNYREALSTVIDICDKFSRNKDNSRPKTKLIFTKLIGDFKDYQHDFTNIEDYVNESKLFYEEAFEIMENYRLEITDPYILSLYLNYSVFLVRKEDNMKKGISICRECINKLCVNGISIKNKNYSEIMFLSQLIKDNMSLWTAQTIINEKREVEKDKNKKRLIET